MIEKTIGGDFDLIDSDGYFLHNILMLGFNTFGCLVVVCAVPPEDFYANKRLDRQSISGGLVGLLGFLRLHFCRRAMVQIGLLLWFEILGRASGGSKFLV